MAKQVNPFYKSTAWLKFRELALLRDNHLCQPCLRQKRITPANTVHHIKPIEDFPELALTLDNVESICPPCHNREHPEKGGGHKKKRKKKVRVIEMKENPEWV
ncbi:HNH endonuclease [Halalkalibacter oceani]|uniref:HNH endonuclease n=1 Tax=Halalkalibacter oceani TaxID=1653776 RepID=UPI003391737C